jgi:hypothetical protein
VSLTNTNRTTATDTNRTTAGMAVIGARAKDAAARAVPVGKRVGTTAVQGARQGVQGTKEWAAPHVQVAREWAAPRLHDAADAVTTTVAPRVSTALHATANRVTPPDTAAQTSPRKLLDWRWLLGLGAVLAAAGGAAAVAMRRRYASATAEAKDATEPDVPGQAEDPSAETASVNGQVTTTQS